MKFYFLFCGLNSMMLEDLNLLYNGEICFFERLGELFFGLISLYVLGNSIKMLFDCFLNLLQFKILDLLNNQLLEILFEFFVDSFVFEILLVLSNIFLVLFEVVVLFLKNLKIVWLNKNKLGEMLIKKQFLIC